MHSAVMSGCARQAAHRWYHGNVRPVIIVPTRAAVVQRGTTTPVAAETTPMRPLTVNPPSAPAPTAYSLLRRCTRTGLTAAALSHVPTTTTAVVMMPLVASQRRYRSNFRTTRRSNPILSGPGMDLNPLVNATLSSGFQQSVACHYGQHAMERAKEIAKRKQQEQQIIQAARQAKGIPLYYSPEFGRSYYFKEEDLREHSALGTGPGGQATNRRMQTAVMLHRPTGIHLRCHHFTSLYRNRVLARLQLHLRLEHFFLGDDASTLGFLKKRQLKAWERRNVGKSRFAQSAHREDVQRRLWDEKQQRLGVLPFCWVHTYEGFEQSKRELSVVTPEVTALRVAASSVPFAMTRMSAVKPKRTATTTTTTTSKQQQAYYHCRSSNAHQQQRRKEKQPHPSAGDGSDRLRHLFQQQQHRHEHQRPNKVITTPMAMTILPSRSSSPLPATVPTSGVIPEWIWAPFREAILGHQHEAQTNVEVVPTTATLLQVRECCMAHGGDALWGCLERWAKGMQQWREAGAAKAAAMLVVTKKTAEEEDEKPKNGEAPATSSSVAAEAGLPTAAATTTATTASCTTTTTTTTTASAASPPATAVPTGGEAVVASSHAVGGGGGDSTGAVSASRAKESAESSGPGSCAADAATPPHASDAPAAIEPAVETSAPNVPSAMTSTTTGSVPPTGTNPLSRRRRRRLRGKRAAALKRSFRRWMRKHHPEALAGGSDGHGGGDSEDGGGGMLSHRQQLKATTITAPLSTPPGSMCAFVGKRTERMSRVLAMKRIQWRSAHAAAAAPAPPLPTHDAIQCMLELLFPALHECGRSDGTCSSTTTAAGRIGVGGATTTTSQPLTPNVPPKPTSSSSSPAASTSLPKKKKLRSTTVAPTSSSSSKPPTPVTASGAVPIPPTPWEVGPATEWEWAERQLTLSQHATDAAAAIRTAWIRASIRTSLGMLLGVFGWHVTPQGQVERDGLNWAQHRHRLAALPPQEASWLFHRVAACLSQWGLTKEHDALIAALQSASQPPMPTATITPERLEASRAVAEACRRIVAGLL